MPASLTASQQLARKPMVVIYDTLELTHPAFTVTDQTIRLVAATTDVTLDGSVYTGSAVSVERPGTIVGADPIKARVAVPYEVVGRMVFDQFKLAASSALLETPLARAGCTSTVARWIEGDDEPFYEVNLYATKPVHSIQDRSVTFTLTEPNPMVLRVAKIYTTEEFTGIPT